MCAHTRRELSLLLSRLSVLRHGIRTDHMNGGVKRNETRIWSGHNDQRPISPRHTTLHHPPTLPHSRLTTCPGGSIAVCLAQSCCYFRPSRLNGPYGVIQLIPLEPMLIILLLRFPFLLWPQGEKEHFLSGHPPI